MKLLSIPKEAAACRAAWAAAPGATMAWHCHHEVLAEPLTEPAENRIAYILSNKPKREQARRLRLFRPAPEAIAPAPRAYNEALDSAGKAYDEASAPARRAYNEALDSAGKAYNEALASAHAIECPDCPWDGTDIFGSGRR